MSRVNYIKLHYITLHISLDSLGEKQVGLSRVITDFSIMYWLYDVFIDEEYQGKGLVLCVIRAIE
ncbi:hypothetical protein V7139_27925 [Neobacillus drentensis]|uniref:hypothetical protein n=1 Tax=Neobacillus drentensis TaxID=220684 RepID=UPI003001018E